jgi:hypothetical protein
MGRTVPDGQQFGDPAAAAKAMLTVLDSQGPPAHLRLGSDALPLVGQARAVFDAETAGWAKLSVSTDYPAGREIP